MSLHIEISQGLRIDDLQALQDKVRLRGGRLVAYSEVISAILVSARSYQVKWVASPEQRKGASVASTFVTAILGWWGFSGPYWSIAALVWNKRGGYDVTEALLQAHPGNKSYLGYSDAVAMAAFQESANRIAFRLCLILASFGLAAFIYAMFHFSIQK